MEFDIKQLAQAMKLIAEEKNLPENMVQEIVEQALGAAYKRDYGTRDQNIRVAVNLNSGAVDVYIRHEVVDEVEDEETQISLKDAQKKKKTAAVGDTIEDYVEVKTFGRVAAQTAKQVIMQRLREAEREIVMAEYEDKVGSVINAVVTRIEARIVRLEVGKAQAIMPQSEQSKSERYFPGQRLKVYLKDIEKSFRGPQLVVSRASTELIRALFEAEVPEMESGAVEIKAIAREAGVRTKIAVHSTVQGVDWDESLEVFIASALSPTKVSKVVIDEDKKRAKILVPEDQLSVAIGKSGQNVRLASKLVDLELDIEAVKSEGDEEKSDAKETKPETVADAKKHKLKRKSELESSLLDAIDEHGE
jgi:N utilization substance protein A